MTVTLRRNDYSLEDEQRQLADMLAALFLEHSPVSLARECEPLGFSAELWKTLAENGLLSMSIPVSAGGDGGGLVELALAGLEVGRRVSPVPLLDHVVALRLLAAMQESGVALPFALSEALQGEEILGFAPISTWELDAQLIPTGAVADAVLAFRAGSIILMRRQNRAPQAPNQGAVPVAWWSPHDPDVEVLDLLQGAQAMLLWEAARREWKIATAASLAGVVDMAGQIARQYALERKAFGSAIASFQAVSHQLADLHMDAVTCTNMVLKAAWLTEHEPEYRPELAAIAMVHASRCALRDTGKAVHVHGGMGISLESDISVYYRKASAWSLMGGGIQRDLEDIGAAIDRRAGELRTGSSMNSFV